MPASAAMKIAISTEHFRPGVGGGENIAIDVTRELRKRGHRVLVCAATGNDPIDFIRVPAAETTEAARNWGAELVVDWGIRFDADVHYLHGAPHRTFLRYAIHATPFWLRWWKHCEFALKKRHRKAIADQERFFHDPQADYLAVSHFVAKQAAEVAAPLKPDIRILYNPVDTDRFTPPSPAERQSMRERLGIAAEAVVFVWVAHNARLKNLRLLLRIFPQIHARNPRAVLLVVGKRKPRKKAPWLVYAGAVERPEETYAAADAMLHPTYFDTFANVVTEALACGIPVVCSQWAGAAEVIPQADCGAVLPVVGKGVEALWAEAALELADNVELRRRQGANGRTLALSLNLERYMDQLEAELRRFIELRRQSTGTGG